MRRQAHPSRQRRGAALVEMAMILPVFLMMLFGIIEYSLYLMAVHTTNVAAMAAVRLAVVSTGEASVTDTVLQTKVFNTMGGVRNRLAAPAPGPMTPASPTITIWCVPEFSQGITTAQPWKSAGWGDAIFIQVSGRYGFITPLRGVWTGAPIVAVAQMAAESN